MWATEVATDEPEELQRRLFEEHAIEVVVNEWEGRSLLRVSIAPYNDASDVERLLDALDSAHSRERGDGVLEVGGRRRPPRRPSTGAPASPPV